MNIPEVLRHQPEVRKGDTEKLMEKGFDIHVYITDHSADARFNRSPQMIMDVYTTLKEAGVQSIRSDWRWNTLQPEQGRLDTDQLERYFRAKQISDQAGLDAPTVILSSPPKWASDLYKSGKKSEFESSFRTYAQTVKAALDEAGGERVTKIQIMNEVNTNIFSPVATEDLPRLCEITRDVFGQDAKLMATFIASNLTSLFNAAKVFSGTPIMEYLDKHEETLRNNFDIIAVDYYPGVWHWPIEDATGKKAYKSLPVLWREEERRTLFKSVVKDMTLLSKVFEKLEGWENTEYELGEVGMPTRKIFDRENPQRAQRYFFDTFFRSFKHLIVDFRSRNKRLPARMGLYAGTDEEALQPQERYWGVLTETGEEKLVLKGHLYSSQIFPQEEMRQPQSQLNRLIKYLRAPMEKKT